MLPAVGDFLKGTFGESLKKPLQPAGIFAAGILLLLHVLFIFPTLVDQNQPLAMAIRDMGAVSQAVLAIVVVLVASYVLLSMSASILKLMSGELWRGSPGIGQRFADWQAGRRRALRRSVWQAETNTTEQRAGRRQDLFRVTRDYPPANALVAPTSLGNVLQATSAYVWDRYRIDMTTLWPHMETIVADDKALSARVDDEKATLDFLLNLAFVLMLFAFEHAALRFSLRQYPEAVWSLGFLVAGWAVYSSAVSKARAWGGAVQLAFDLYRDKLRERFRLRAFSSPDDEREVWRRLSRWLMWGEPLDESFLEGASGSPSRGPKLVHADNIKVQVVSAEQVNITFTNGKAVSTVAWEKSLEYALLASAAGSGAAVAQGAYVLVSDTRLPAVTANRALTLKPEIIEGEHWTAADKPAPAGAGSSPTFLFTRASIEANGASLLRYRLGVASVTLAANGSVGIGEHSNVTQRQGLIAFDCTFELFRAKARGGAAELTLIDRRIVLPEPRLLLPGRLVGGAVDAQQLIPVHRVTGDCEQHYVVELPMLADSGVRMLRCLLLTSPLPPRSERLQDIIVSCPLWPEVKVRLPKPLEPDWLRLAADGGTVIDWKKLRPREDLHVWAWILMELDDVPEDSLDAGVLNNLGCAWMQFAEWDRADECFRAALTPQVIEVSIRDPRWREGDPTPKSAKEAADQNLYQVSRARDAWMRGI